MYEPSGRDDARSAIVRSRIGSVSYGAPGRQLAAVKAGPLAGVARRAGRLDEREQRIRVAVVANRLQRLGVARGLALVPLLLARAAVEVHLAALARATQRLRVHVREGQDLAGPPVLDDARHQAALVECDL